MGLDIRLPIGLLFSLIGTLLTLVGVFADRALYARSLSININLWWGLVMLAFGVICLVLSRRHSAAMRSSAQSAEGRAMEAREHAIGLERENTP